MNTCGNLFRTSGLLVGLAVALCLDAPAAPPASDAGAATQASLGKTADADTNKGVPDYGDTQTRGNLVQTP